MSTCRKCAKTFVGVSRGYDAEFARSVLLNIIAATEVGNWAAADSECARLQTLAEWTLGAAMRLCNDCLRQKLEDEARALLAGLAAGLRPEEVSP